MFMGNSGIDQEGYMVYNPEGHSLIRTHYFCFLTILESIAWVSCNYK